MGCGKRWGVGERENKQQVKVKQTDTDTAL